MLARRLHDLSRAGPPTLIGKQAARGSRKVPFNATLPAFGPLSAASGRIHRGRSASIFFPPKAPFTYASKTNDCIRAPLARTPHFWPTSRCRIAIQREFGARWDSRPGFHAQLISWSANPSSAAAPYAVRCTVRHEKEYHGQTTYAFDHDR